LSLPWKPFIWLCHRPGSVSVVYIYIYIYIYIHIPCN
jgi:hypothetical protein